MADYFTKPVKAVQPGDYVMVAGSPPFVVRKYPEYVEQKNGKGHIHLEGRTKLGRKAAAVVYQWDHKVLCRGRNDD